MLGLRQKLVLAFGGMLLILLIVSGLGIAVLKQHRSALDKQRPQFHARVTRTS